MSATAVILILVSAVAHAGWNLAGKRTGPSTAFFLVASAAGACCLVPLLFFYAHALAAIPVALLFGGLTNGGRFVQGKLKLGFGVDFALLGVLMITLVAFQFFYSYKIVWVKAAKEEEYG